MPLRVLCAALTLLALLVGYPNPAFAGWETSMPMSVARASHTATTLLDGRALIAGGDGGAAPLSSAELFDPMSHQFMPAGAMNVARAAHTATKLLDGRVLVAGGLGAGAGA